MKQQSGKVFYGWKLVAALWVIYFFTAATVTYGVSGVVLPELVLEYGWSENTVSYATTAFNAANAAGALFAGALFHRFGMKRVMIAGGILEVAGFLIAAVAGVSQPGVVALFGVMGFAMTMTIIISAANLVNNWFDRNKSMPMSLVLTAGSVGGFVVPGVISALMAAAGIRGSFYVMTVLEIIAVILMIVFVIEKPEQIGEIRDGHHWVSLHPLDGKQEADTAGEEEGVSVAQAMKGSRFYILGAEMLVVRAVYVLVVSYIVLFAQQKALGSGAGVLLLTIYNVSSLAGRVTAGGADRLPLSKQALFCLTLFLMAGGCFLMTVGSGMVFYVAGVILLGMTFGLIYSLMPILVSVFFGRKYYADIYGIYNTLGGVGSAVMPMLMVALLAIGGGSYSLTYTVMTAACLVSGLAGLTLLPKKEAGKRPAGQDASGRAESKA